MLTDHGAAVAAAWAYVSAGLGAFLRARGVRPHDVDDITQECAARALDRGVPFRDADDLLRWCTAVARNAHVDLCRLQARVTSEPSEDLAGSDDVPREVAARLELQSVTAAWGRLSAADRTTLVAAAEFAPVPAARREAVRLYVRRNRARQRLQAMLGAVVLGFGAAGRLLRRQAAAIPLTTATTAALCFALAPWSSPRSHDHQTPPVRRGGEPSATGAVPEHLPPARTPGGAAPTRQHSGSVTPPPSHTRIIASAKGPHGMGATVESHDRDASQTELACIGDLPLLPDTCVDDPLGSPSVQGLVSAGR